MGKEKNNEDQKRSKPSLKSPKGKEEEFKGRDKEGSQSVSSSCSCSNNGSSSRIKDNNSPLHNSTAGAALSNPLQWDQLVPVPDISKTDEGSSPSRMTSSRRPFSQGAEDLLVSGECKHEAVSSDNSSETDKSPFRRSRTLPFRRKKKPEKVKETKKKRSSLNFWNSFRLNKKLPGRFKKNKDHGLSEPMRTTETAPCVCTGYRRTDEHSLGVGVVFNNTKEEGTAEEQSEGATAAPIASADVDDLDSEVLNWLDETVDFDTARNLGSPPQELLDELSARNLTLTDLGDWGDIDEIRMILRRRDIETGIDMTDSQIGYKFRGGSPRNSRKSTSQGASARAVDDLASRMRSKCTLGPPSPTPTTTGANTSSGAESSDSDSFDKTSNKLLTRPVWTGFIPNVVHTQVDYIHCLVPDLVQITGCSFYWGVMDRYEAEKLLDNRPEGTFLLRDSAQEEFLFSVSFRRYGRSLHARIEQWNHKFSFDSHDPGVYASDTVCGLLEHYKDPSCCMFFEPMLTRPLNRSFPFSLQHMCRAVIAGTTTYDGINYLPLPKSLINYLKYYHYKQKVRVRKFECPH